MDKDSLKFTKNGKKIFLYLFNGKFFIFITFIAFKTKTYKIFQNY